jgi:hypothetical protein
MAGMSKYEAKRTNKKHISSLQQSILSRDSCVRWPAILSPTRKDAIALGMLTWRAANCCMGLDTCMYSRKVT